MKRCTKCSAEKPVEQFNRRGDGRRSYCKACQAEMRKRYVGVPEDRDRKLERHRRYRETHVEQAREYRQANRERDAESQRQRRAGQRETIAAAQRRYYREIRAQVFAHYGERCACCGTAGNLSIDHVNGDGAAHRRELKSGSSIRLYCWLISEGFPAGFQVLCKPCNLSKRDGDRCLLEHAVRTT